MKAKVIGAVVVVLAMVGPTADRARADFTLSGHDQLTVDTADNVGNLSDWSGVDVVQGGSMVYLHSRDSSTVKVSGGTVTDSVFAEGSSAVTVLGGSVNRISVHKTATANILGGTVGSISADHSSSVSISEGSVNYVLLRSESSANVSGGSVDLMVTSLFPVCGPASLTISNGSVDTLLLSLNLYGSKRLSITEDPFAAGLSLPGVSIAEGTVGKMTVSFSIYDTSVMDCSTGSMAYVLSANDSSTVNISGGKLGALNARETSTVTFIGEDFVLGERLSLEGQKLLGTGVLSGKWLDGTPWSVNISANADGATILLVPEPATLSLLALGGLALIRRRRR